MPVTPVDNSGRGRPPSRVGRSRTLPSLPDGARARLAPATPSPVASAGAAARSPDEGYSTTEPLTFGYSASATPSPVASAGVSSSGPDSRASRGKRKLPTAPVSKNHAEAINRSVGGNRPDESHFGDISVIADIVSGRSGIRQEAARGDYIMRFGPIDYALYWVNSRGRGFVKKDSLSKFNKGLSEVLVALYLSDSIFTKGAFEARDGKVILKKRKEGRVDEVQFNKIKLPMIIYSDNGDSKEYHISIQPVIGFLGVDSISVMAECLFGKDEMSEDVMEVINNAINLTRDKIEAIDLPLIHKAAEEQIIFSDSVELQEEEGVIAGFCEDIDKTPLSSKNNQRALARLDKHVKVVGSDRFSFFEDRIFNDMLGCFLFPEESFVGGVNGVKDKGYKGFISDNLGNFIENFRFLERSDGALIRNGYDPEGKEGFDGKFFESIFGDICSVIKDLGVNPFMELDGFGKYRHVFSDERSVEIGLNDYLKLRFVEKLRDSGIFIFSKIDDKKRNIEYILRFVDELIDCIAEVEDVNSFVAKYKKNEKGRDGFEFVSMNRSNQERLFGANSEIIRIAEIMGNVRDFLVPYKDEKGRIVFDEMFWRFFGKMEQVLNSREFDLVSVSKDRAQLRVDTLSDYYKIVRTDKVGIKSAISAYQAGIGYDGNEFWWQRVGALAKVFGGSDKALGFVEAMMQNTLTRFEEMVPSKLVEDVYGKGVQVKDIGINHAGSREGLTSKLDDSASAVIAQSSKGFTQFKRSLPLDRPRSQTPAPRDGRNTPAPRDGRNTPVLRDILGRQTPRIEEISSRPGTPVFGGAPANNPVRPTAARSFGKDKESDKGGGKGGDQGNWM